MSGEEGYPAFQFLAYGIDSFTGQCGYFKTRVTYLGIEGDEADCKYGNCTHSQEPGCAVRKAVEEHYISESRYTSYLSMLEDKEEGKYRAAY